MHNPSTTRATSWEATSMQRAASTAFWPFRLQSRNRLRCCFLASLPCGFQQFEVAGLTLLPELVRMGFRALRIVISLEGFGDETLPGRLGGAGPVPRRCAAGSSGLHFYHD